MSDLVDEDLVDDMSDLVDGHGLPVRFVAHRSQLGRETGHRGRVHAPRLALFQQPPALLQLSSHATLESQLLSLDLLEPLPPLSDGLLHA